MSTNIKETTATYLINKYIKYIPYYTVKFKDYTKNSRYLHLTLIGEKFTINTQNSVDTMAESYGLEISFSAENSIRLDDRLTLDLLDKLTKMQQLKVDRYNIFDTLRLFDIKIANKE